MFQRRFKELNARGSCLQIAKEFFLVFLIRSSDSVVFWDVHIVFRLEVTCFMVIFVEILSCDGTWQAKLVGNSRQGK